MGVYLCVHKRVYVHESIYVHVCIGMCTHTYGHVCVYEGFIESDSEVKRVVHPAPRYEQEGAGSSVTHWISPGGSGNGTPTSLSAHHEEVTESQRASQVHPILTFLKAHTVGCSLGGWGAWKPRSPVPCVHIPTPGRHQGEPGEDMGS